jgi:CspA family cold shock protein
MVPTRAKKEFVVLEGGAVSMSEGFLSSGEVVPPEIPKDDFRFGTVKWFSRMKGWGFIEPDNGERDVFVHYENIVGEGFRNLEKGERVKFQMTQTPKGPKAMAVVSVEETPTPEHYTPETQAVPETGADAFQ